MLLETACTLYCCTFSTPYFAYRLVRRRAGSLGTAWGNGVGYDGNILATCLQANAVF
jgi:hypothetical protein